MTTVAEWLTWHLNEKRYRGVHERIQSLLEMLDEFDTEACSVFAGKIRAALRDRVGRRVSLPRQPEPKTTRNRLIVDRRWRRLPNPWPQATKELVLFEIGFEADVADRDCTLSFAFKRKPGARRVELAQLANREWVSFNHLYLTREQWPLLVRCNHRGVEGKVTLHFTEMEEPCPRT